MGNLQETIKAARAWATVGVLLLSLAGCASVTSNDVPTVVWTSLSGDGPFSEITRTEFIDAGWTKVIGEAHRYYCDIKTKPQEEYLLRLVLPKYMELTGLSLHPEWSSRPRGEKSDLGWCKVKRGEGWAEILFPPTKCQWRRHFRLRMEFHERGWPFFSRDEK